MICKINYDSLFNVQEDEMPMILYKEFAERLVYTMKLRGYIASRSPNGICMKTLADFADASEQICRRYIRGEALPSHEKMIKIAQHLEVSPAWLVFGDEAKTKLNAGIDDELLHYILKRIHELYRHEASAMDDFADFVLGLIKDIREIETSRENLEKIIDLAVASISSFRHQAKQKAI